MQKRLFKYIFIALLPIMLFSCNTGKDTTELWKKANTTGEIIARSGTVFNSGQDKDLALRDAQNRLRTGGGLFGKKAGLPIFGEKNDAKTTSIGMPINPYLWKGSLDTIDFMPLSSADPFGGIIITDWYTDLQNKNQRCKINIYIKGIELKTNNLKVNSFCQNFEDNKWIDIPTNINNNTQLENAILNKAKKLKLSKG